MILKLKNGDEYEITICWCEFDTYIESAILYRKNCDPYELTDDECNELQNNQADWLCKQIIEHYGYMPD